MSAPLKAMLSSLQQDLPGPVGLAEASPQPPEAEGGGDPAAQGLQQPSPHCRGEHIRKDCTQPHARVHASAWVVVVLTPAVVLCRGAIGPRQWLHSARGGVITSFV